MSLCPQKENKVRPEPELRKGQLRRQSSMPSQKIYHEKQSRELCALHALNNLFQETAFTKSQLDGICSKLAPTSYINPHKSMIGLGNYDVNVLMFALQSKQWDTVWFDKRRDLNNLVLCNIFGFILNIPTDLRWGYLRIPFRRKHWICLREIDGSFFNLDSKLDTPLLIGDAQQLHAYLQEELEDKEKELLLVVSPDVSLAKSWYSNVLDVSPSNCDQS